MAETGRTYPVHVVKRIYPYGTRLERVGTDPKGKYVLMFPPDPLRVDARRWSGRRYKRDRRRYSSTNHRCAKIGFNRAEDEQ